MKIIAGTKKGHTIVGPKGNVTRPLTGRVREALFSSLGGVVEGATVADLFAGSGSIGLESLSRGAASVVFVEIDRRVGKVLRQNVERIGLGGTVVSSRVEHFLAKTKERFDLVFVDPPYAMSDVEVAAIVEQVSLVLDDNGLVVLHRRVGQSKPVTSLSIMHERRYGDAVIWRLEKDTP